LSNENLYESSNKYSKAILDFDKGVREIFKVKRVEIIDE
jgi:hypothetical protein